MTPERLDTERRPNIPEAPTDTEVDAESVRRRLRYRSARIECREVEEALSKLDACGGVTAEQRRIVRLLGATLTRRLTAVPEAALERGDRDDEAFVRTLARLFAHESHLDTSHKRS